MPRVAFAGTPDFALPALEALYRSKKIELVAVYTQPDRPAGRGRQLSVSPVKKFATTNSLPIFQPENFNNELALSEFKSLALDVLVVAAYGLILPQTVLDAVRYPINIHASLLPRWRGAAPIQRSIMAGDEKTGVTIIRIIKKLDAGPTWLQSSCEIERNDTASSLHDKLAALGAQAITAALEMVITDEITEQAQNSDLVTYAEKLSAADRALDWAQSSEDLLLKIRALNPTPVATMNLSEQKCKIWEATIDNASDTHNGVSKAGEILYARNDGIGVRTKNGVLKITKIQPPGKKPMFASDFLNGYADRFGISDQ